MELSFKKYHYEFGMHALISTTIALLFFYQWHDGDILSVVLPATYQTLIGDDELAWLSLGINLGKQCFRMGVNLWPSTICSFKNTDYFILTSFFVFKRGLYLLVVYQLVKHLKVQYEKVHWQFAGIFLLYNPYVMLLQSSLMRDDLILTIVLFSLSCYIYARYQSNGLVLPRLLALMKMTLAVLIMLNVRPQAAIIPMLLLLFLLYDFNKPITILVATVAVIFIIRLPVVSYNLQRFTSTLNFSPLHLLKGHIDLLFSPWFWNVLSLRVIENRYGTANVPIWSIFINLFNLCFFQLSLLSLYFSKFRRHLWQHVRILVVMYSYLLIYVLYDDRVQGPRQALPVTTLFHLLVTGYLVHHLVQYLINQQSENQALSSI